MVEYILQDGLDPNPGWSHWKLSSGKDVYLSKTPERAENWIISALEGGDFGNESGETQGAVLEIDATRLNPKLLKKDPISHEDLAYSGKIPPEAIKFLRLTREID